MRDLPALHILPVPECPECGAHMKLIKPGAKDWWTPFWGCSEYMNSKCRGSRSVLDNGYPEGVEQPDYLIDEDYT